MRLGEFRYRALEIAHADVAPDRQTFDLRELYFAAGRDLLLPIAHAGQDDANRLAAAIAQFPHGANLTGRGVRAQQNLGIGGVKGVLHIPGWMMRRQVEQRKVEFVFFYIKTLINLKAHFRPDRLKFAVCAGRGMQSAHYPRVRRQRNIDGAFFQIVRYSHVPYQLNPLLIRGLQLSLQHIYLLTKCCSFVLRHAANGAEKTAYHALSAEIFAPPCGQGIVVRDFAQGLQRVLTQRLYCLSHVSFLCPFGIIASPA